MIYSLTLNPALDHIVRLSDLELGETNRMKEETIKAGGKGINVSMLLKNLDEESIVLGFIGGFTGLEIERSLREDHKLVSDLIHVKKGFTRINVKIKSKVETEINGPGLDISKKEVDLLFEKLEQIKDGDYLFLSGSIPKSLEEDFYKKIFEKLNKKDVKIIVDASGDALKNTLDKKPYLIKPNLMELEEIFDTNIKTKKHLSFYAKSLQDEGAKNIIVSLGKAGAYMLDDQGKEYYSKAPSGKLVDSVGSGDSMVAGFIYAKKNGYTNEESFKFSIACGSATAFSDELGKKDEIYNLYKQL